MLEPVSLQWQAMIPTLPGLSYSYKAKQDYCVAVGNVWELESLAALAALTFKLKANWHIEEKANRLILQPARVKNTNA